MFALRPLTASGISMAAALWRAEQLEVYREPASLPDPEDCLDFFRDVTYPSCESWWVLPHDQTFAAILGLKHEHIAHLFVRPESRGNGRGKSLVAYAKTIYPRRLTVCTAAQVSGFYLNLGFAIEETTLSAPEQDQVRLRWQP